MPLDERAIRWPIRLAAAVTALAATAASAQQRYAPPAPAPRQAPPAPGAPVQQPAAAPPAAPVRPFPELTAAEQLELDQTLAAWEKATGQITSMACQFTRWEEDLVFKKNIQTNGEIKYRAPDKGLYRLNDGSEHWICDGMSVFNFDSKQKQVIERKLPPELQGKAIVDGPLPFLFSADAKKLKQRYFLRLDTPAAQKQAGFVWIQAFPRFQRDAANFQEATLVLRVSDMQATALEVVMPGGKSKTAHVFTQTTVNGNAIIRFLAGDFTKPKIPTGWKLVQAQTAPPQQPAGPQQPVPPAQAQHVPLAPRQNLPPR